MSNGTIHYRNKPFQAIVEGESDEPITIVPGVYDELANCGIVIIYPDGRGSIWGMMSPRNLIASWRATEIIRHLDRIEHGTLCDCYYAGLRNPHSSDQERIDRIVAKIGKGTYDAIMSKPVPEEIIRAILDNQDNEEERPAPNVWPIAEEVRAGTLEWRDEFAAAGVEHPDETDRKKAEQEATIARFEKYLESLAKWRSFPRACMGMWEVEDGILTVVKHGVDKEYGDKIAVAVAGVAAELMGADFVRFMMPSVGPRSEDELYRSMERTKREAAEKMSRWLNSLGTDDKKWWQLRRREAEPTVSHTELLLRLVNECFPAKNKELAEQVSSDFDAASNG